MFVISVGFDASLRFHLYDKYLFRLDTYQHFAYKCNITSYWILIRIKPCHTRAAASSKRFHSLQKSCRSLWTRCKDAVQPPRTPCGGFFFNMLKTNAAAWRLHSVLDSAMWKRCGNAVGSSRAQWARCGRAACTL